MERTPGCHRGAMGVLLVGAAALVLAAPGGLPASPPAGGLITPNDYDVPARPRAFHSTSFDGSTRDVKLGDYPAVPAAARIESPAAAPRTASAPPRVETLGDGERSPFDAALRDGPVPPLPVDPAPAATQVPTPPSGDPLGGATELAPAPAINLDNGTDLDTPFGDSDLALVPRGPGTWRKQVLPAGLLYKSYLAGEKESRMALQTLYESGRGMIWEVALGGRVGIWRYGTPGVFNAEGWQIDIEGASFVRLDLEQAQDVDAADFRFGIPITYRKGPLAYKFGYYHISSHTGDEYLVKHPNYTRINYVRESFLFGLSYDVNEDWRVYGEVAYGWHVSGGAKPWELQFGAEYSPLHPFGDRRHAPFAAVNIHLREDFGMGGSINTEAGWQWRGAQTNHLLRLGLQYFNGKSIQYSFFDRSEQLFGVGLWFDY